MILLEKTIKAINEKQELDFFTVLKLKDPEKYNDSLIKNVVSVQLQVMEIYNKIYDIKFGKKFIG